MRCFLGRSFMFRSLRSWKRRGAQIPRFRASQRRGCDVICVHISGDYRKSNIGLIYRILDPILVRLMGLSAAHPEGIYRETADISYTQYLLESIATLFRFGAQGLSRACQSTDVSQSSHPALLKHVDLREYTRAGRINLNMLVQLEHPHTWLCSPTWSRRKS